MVYRPKNMKSYWRNSFTVVPVVALLILSAKLALLLITTTLQATLEVCFAIIAT
jgi:hypothetical protein